jgi:hypothetical protein
MEPLEESLTRLKGKKYSLIETEIFAIEHLSGKEEITEFYEAYLERIKDNLKQEFSESKDNKGTQLIRQGYSLDDIAEYLAKDHLSFTLGHIYKDNCLDLWYSHIPALKKEFNFRI